MQVFIYCKITLRVSSVIAAIIRSTSNCNYSFWYKSYDLYQKLQLQFDVLLMMGAI